MSLSERNYGAVEGTFSLTVDRYGHLWLHTKLEGVPVSLDLGPNDTAFEIMAAAMLDNGFEYNPYAGHDPADNDDER